MKLMKLAKSLFLKFHIIRLLVQELLLFFLFLWKCYTSRHWEILHLFHKGLLFKEMQLLLWNWPMRASHLTQGDKRCLACERNFRLVLHPSALQVYKSLEDSVKHFVCLFVRVCPFCLSVCMCLFVYLSINISVRRDSFSGPNF